MKLKPIRTKDEWRRGAGGSWWGFHAKCLPHTPFLRRVRLAWMVLRGLDLSQYDIDCGHHRIDEVAKQVEKTPTESRRAIAESLRLACEAFDGEEEELKTDPFGFHEERGDV